MKLVRFIFLFSLVGLGFWLLNLSNDKKNVEELEDLLAEPDKKEEKTLRHMGPEFRVKPKSYKSDNVSVKQAAIKKSQSESNVRPMSDEDINSMESQYSKVQSNWNSHMSQLIQEEFGMSPEVYSEYIDIKGQFLSDKMRAYELQQEEDFENEDNGKPFDHYVVQEYTQKMKALLGESNYERYKEALEEFNDEVEDQSDGMSPTVYIEF